MAEKKEPLLQVENLQLHYRTNAGIARAVDRVGFEIFSGEALVILGESGCGKSSLAKALLRLLPRNVANFSGTVTFKGKEISSLSEEQFRSQVRWREISMVMQAAMNALNPVIRVCDQVAEPLCVHFGESRKKAMDRVAEAFDMVGISTDFLKRFPFELSGGMRQRAVLAMALVTRPSLIILDEPTSALDVLTQSSIMNVLKRIKRELGTGFMLITHDVATSSELADRVALMYAGQLVEVSSARDFFHEPAHPYSKLLMSSVPRLRQEEPPSYIPGVPPNLLNPPSGCRFAERCPNRFEKCDSEPEMNAVGQRRTVRCFKFEKEVPQ